MAALPSAAQTVTSSKAAEFGVKVGAKAPAISGVTQDGAPATFESLKGDKGLVIAFVRSADWCPFCKAQLEDLNLVAADLKKKGYPVVSVSYDPAATLKSFATKKAIAFTMVSDPDSKTIDAFGVRNEDMRGKPRFDGIPHPVIYIIGADGVVKSKLYEEGYKNRPAAKVVAETAAAIN
jgi:peroxiredoxin